MRVDLPGTDGGTALSLLMLLLLFAGAYTGTTCRALSDHYRQQHRASAKLMRELHHMDQEVVPVLTSSFQPSDQAEKGGREVMAAESASSASVGPCEPRMSTSNRFGREGGCMRGSRVCVCMCLYVCVCTCDLNASHDGGVLC